MVAIEIQASSALDQSDGCLPPKLTERNKEEKFLPKEKAGLTEDLRALWNKTRPNPETAVMSFVEAGIESGYYPDDGFWTKQKKEAGTANHVYIEIEDGLNEKTTLREILSLSQRIHAIGSATAIVPNVLALRSDRPIDKGDYTELSAITELIGLFELLHVKRLVTLDTHAPSFAYEAAKREIAVLDLTAIPTLLQEAIDRDLLDRPCFVCADGGGYEMAELTKELAKRQDIEFDSNEAIIKGSKTRDEKGKSEVTFTADDLERVNERTVVITEDMISSGDTLTEVVTQMKNAGAKNIVVLATFGVFSEGSVEKLQELKDTTIIITDARDPLTPIDGASNIMMVPIKYRLSQVAELDRQGINFWSEEGQAALAALGLALAPWQTHHGDI